MLSGVLLPEIDVCLLIVFLLFLDIITLNNPNISSLRLSLPPVLILIIGLEMQSMLTTIVYDDRQYHHLEYILSAFCL